MQLNFIQPTTHSDNLSRYVSNGILSQEGVNALRLLIYDYYATHKRLFSWRDCDNAYFVVVSEIMLQQTQTDRVKEKYQQFIQTFPTIESLAAAPVRDVIASWQGLGYNRRGLALHAFAQRVVADYGSEVPNDPIVLETFRGIGPATAASICAFAFNKPTLFIETNIRTVFIHCFFKDHQLVSDKMLMPLIEQTLERDNARQWYYALMDYGVMLKKIHKNPSRKSAHYTIQSKFEGSDRQIRGLILKMLVEHTVLSYENLCELLQRDPQRIALQLTQLVKEQFIEEKTTSFYRLKIT